MGRDNSACAFACKGLNEHHLWRLGGGGVALPGSAKALGVAYIRPICRFVDRSREPLWVHKGLQQHQRMAEGFQPIAREPFLAQREDARSEIWTMPIRQDQKTTVVGQ